MRKILILTVIIVVACTAIALAGWQVASWVRGDKDTRAPGRPASAGVKGQGADGASAQQAAEGQDEQVKGSGGDTGEAGATKSGESAQYDNPDQRYVTETQRHQNFFKGLAEGSITRLDVTTTDFQPAGDPNSSYVYVILSTTDGKKVDGRIVMKYGDGVWRIAAVRLTGSLSGGTGFNVPDSFEADLSRLLVEQQDFLKKVAEGRLAFMSIDSVKQAGANEVILTGEVGSKGGNTFPSEMRLRKDYELWHLTNISAL